MLLHSTYMSDQKEEEERWRGGAEFAKLLFGLVFSLGEYFPQSVLLETHTSCWHIFYTHFTPTLGFYFLIINYKPSSKIKHSLVQLKTLYKIQVII